MLGLLHSSRPNPPRCPIQMPPPPGDNHCKLKGLRVLLTPIREKDLGGTFIGPELQPVAATGTRTEVLVPSSLGRLAVLAGMFSAANTVQATLEQSSQRRPLKHFALDNSSLWEAVLCIAGC